MDYIRLSLFFAPLAAGVVSLILLLILIRTGILPQDLPNNRSLHVTPVPRSGGIAIIAPVFIAGWLVAPPFRLTLACATFLTCVSFLDDLHPMPPLIRLLTHVAAAGVLVTTELWQLTPASSICVVLAIVWMTNLYNFMDGSDGMAGGMSVFGFGCYAAVAMASSHVPMALLAASISACAIAFLVYNFHPARIFMGDSGSVPLGFLAGTLGATGWDEGLWSPFVPVLAFSPFIADASFTLMRRILTGERFWLPHRDHYYQRLIRMGLGHRRTALAAYALMAATTASAIVLRWIPEQLQFAILTLWALFYIVLAAHIDRRWQDHRKGIHDSA